MHALMKYLCAGRTAGVMFPGFRIDRTRQLLSSDEYDAIEKTMHAFATKHLELNADFNVWEYSKWQLIGFVMGMFVYERLVTTSKGADALLGFILEIYASYNDTPYHSAYHAIDVVCMTWHLLEHIGLSAKLKMQRHDIAVLLIAALCHDVLHPGENNDFQIQSQSPIAAQYGNLSVLEKYSSDYARKKIISHALIQHMYLPKFKTLQDAQAYVLGGVNECILHTDMRHHFTHLETLLTITESTESSLLKRIFCRVPSENPIFNTQVMCNVILHAADISNVLRPFESSKRWSLLVLEEFNAQTVKEKQLDLTPSIPESNASQSEAQLAFIELSVRPYFEAMTKIFPEMMPLLDRIKENQKIWKDIQKKEIETKTEEEEEFSSSFILQEKFKNIRRLSVAAGVLQVPESLEKYNSKSGHKQKRSIGSRKEATMADVPEEE